MLELTDYAVKKFKELLTKSEAEDFGIRIFAAGGGCCPGYGLDASENGKAGDMLIQKDGLKIFLEPAAYDNLSQATIDYDEGFVIKGVSTC